MVMLLLLPSPTFVFAQTPSALFDLQVDEPHRELAHVLNEHVFESMQRSSLYRVKRVPVAINEVAVVLNCSRESTSCLRMIAAEVDAQVLVYGALQQREDGVQLALNVFDRARGSVVARLSRTLPTADEATFREAIEELFANDDAMTLLRVGSNVVGADVWIDGVLVGVTPLERKDFETGTYTIRVSHDAFATWEEHVEVRAGNSTAVWAQLEPAETRVVLPESAAVTKRRLSPLAGGVLLTGGVSALGSVLTAVLMKRTERTLRAESAAGTLTSERFSTLNGRGESLEKIHLITLGVGVAALAVGGAMLAIDLLGDRTATVAIGPAAISAKVTW